MAVQTLDFTYQVEYLDKNKYAATSYSVSPMLYAEGSTPVEAQIRLFERFTNYLKELQKQYATERQAEDGPRIISQLRQRHAFHPTDAN